MPWRYEMRSTKLVVLRRGQCNWQWRLLGALRELIEMKAGYKTHTEARTAGRNALRTYKANRILT